VFQKAKLVGPFARNDLLALHLTEISLDIDAHIALSGQIFHYLRRKIIGQQRAQMKHPRLDILQLTDGERSRLGQHALGTVVHILAIAVLEEHVVGTVENSDADACLTQFLYLQHHLAVDSRHQLKVDIVWKGLKRPGNIVSCASGTISIVTGGDDMVTRNMSNAANIFHFVFYFCYL